MTNNNSQYIVKAIDNKVVKGFELEYEFSNIEHAKHLFYELYYDTEGYTDVFLYEHNLLTDKYHLIQC